MSNNFLTANIAGLESMQPNDQAYGYQVNRIAAVLNGVNPIPLITGPLTIQGKTSINPGPLIVGSISPQSNALLSVRLAGNDIEFGHNNPAGYGSTIGSESSSGTPFLAFNAEAGTNTNTFRTRGFKGAVLESDLAGGFVFKTVATASADNQTATNLATLSSAGNLTVLGTNTLLGNAAGGAFVGGIVVAGHTGASELYLPYTDGNVYLDAAVGILFRVNADTALASALTLSSAGLATIANGLTITAGGETITAGNLTVSAGNVIVTGDVDGNTFEATGATSLGSPRSGRFVGEWTTAGAPTGLTAELGDFGFDGSQFMWVCTVAGTPGTWTTYPAGNLGYVVKTTNQTGFSAIADITGLSVTVTVGSGRRIKVSGKINITQNTSTGSASMYLYESTTQLDAVTQSDLAGWIGTRFISVILTPTAGSHTYKLRLSTDAGTVDENATTTVPAYIMVEDIGV